MRILPKLPADMFSRYPLAPYSEASPKKLRDDPEKAWVPDRISSLAALMGQAKALLQK